MNIISSLKNVFVKEKNIIDPWFDTPESIRFTLLASLNMGFRYVLFIALSLLFNNLHYQVNLFLMWFISSFIAFYSYKKLVFNTQGNHLKEYLKSIAIWTLSYIINAGLLEIMIEHMQLNLYFAQTIAIGLLLITNYLLFKHFAFRKPSPLRFWEKVLSIFDITR